MDSRWLVLEDYNFQLDDYLGQIDLLVLIGNTWLIVEVKNYKNDFYYDGRRGWFNGAKDLKRFWVNAVDRIKDVLVKYQNTSYRHYPDPLTDFDWTLMYKNVYCYSCRSYKLENRQRHFYCPNCQKLESKKDAVQRCARELRTLFLYNERIVTTNVSDKIRLYRNVKIKMYN